MPEITRTDRKIKDLFSNKEFIGDVIRFTAILEFELECLLTQYFIREDRTEEGITYLISNLTFNSKVEILAKLPIRESVTSFPKAVAGLRRFRKIRNLAAHRWTISFLEAKNLSNSSEYKNLVLDYPSGLLRDFYETRNYLGNLSRVKEFLGTSGKKSVDSGMRAVMAVFK